MNIPGSGSDASRFRSLLLFDGVCGLCNRLVQFVLDRDRAKSIGFAPLQGRSAQQFTPRHPDIPGDASSMIYIRNPGAQNERVFTRSDATLAVLRDLGGFWRVVSWFRFVPRFIRDFIYAFVAQRRYRWFGKLDSCRVPDPAQRGRFLD